MSKHRIFVEQLPTHSSEFELQPRTAHYVGQVLRLRGGDPLWLFDGRGNEWQARLVSCENDLVRVHITDQITVTPESPLSITLIQGISRGERMDYALQKATELGVARIQPVFCQRSGVKLKGPRLEKRHAHWQSVVISACEQSTRASVPEVEPTRSLLDYLAEIRDQASTRLILLPDARASFRQITVPADGLMICVGPEGGLTRIEIQAAFEQGFNSVRLGPRVLRTETAGPAAIAAAQLLWGDLG